MDGNTIELFSELQSMIMLSAGETLSIVVDRNGERLTSLAVPERQEQSDRMGGTQNIGVLGITAGAFNFERDDPATALVQGVRETVLIIRPDACLCRQAADRKGKRRAAVRANPHRAGCPARSSPPRGIGLDLPDCRDPRFQSVFSIFFRCRCSMAGTCFSISSRRCAGRPLSPRLQDLGFRIGFALVIMLFIFVTFNDIANISGIFAKS